MRLLHAALAMSFCIPGHCALPMAVIPVSWWAACSPSRASVGMIIFSPCNPTGPLVGSSELTLEFLGQFSLLLGVASLMMFTRVVMMVSWAEWVSSLSLGVAFLFLDMMWTVWIVFSVSKLREAREAMAVAVMHCSVSQLVTASARLG